MSTSKEHVFVVGASGAIGIDVVRGLVKKGIDTTAYVRDESKAKNLFKDELLTGHLAIVVGTYPSVDVYTKAIEGHTRLVLLAVGDVKRPTSMSEVKETFGKIAYEKGIIRYMHITCEEKLWTLADEKPDERSLVVLRPGAFMNNQFMSDIPSVKHLNKLVSTGLPSSTQTWINKKDIADCSVVVLTEPVEKHNRCVYEMGTESLSNEQRAAIFSKILGKSITYQQQSAKVLYKMLIGLGMSHSFAYDLISLSFETTIGNVTTQLSILINRPLRTMQEWLQENAKAFQ